MKKNNIPENLDKIVTIEWVRDQMKLHNISQQDIANDIVYSKGRVSDILNPKGRNPLSTKFQKLFFWLYFQNINNINTQLTINTKNQDECFELMTYAIGLIQSRDTQDTQEKGDKEEVRKFVADCQGKGFYTIDVIMKPIEKEGKTVSVDLVLEPNQSPSN